MKYLVTDLGALRRMLAGRGKERKLTDLIRKFESYHSALLDLKRSWDALSRVGVIDGSHGSNFGPQDPNLLAAARAFAFEAVVIYARATGTSSDHRKDRLAIDDWLTSEQLTKHRRIMRLRNDAFAHFGPGGAASGIWHEQRAVVIGESAPKFVYATTNYRGQDMNDLAELVSTLIEKCSEILPTLKSHLAELLAHTAKRNRVVAEAINNPSFSLTSIFSEEVSSRIFKEDLEFDEGPKRSVAASFSID